MARRAFTQLRLIHPLRRVRLRLALSAVVAVLAVGVGAGFAVAATRATLIGSGVVVIETNLGYENAQAAGTGMVLTSSGKVLTNNHVIRGATTIRIVVPGTGHSYTARVVGYDASADVAVLQATGAFEPEVHRDRQLVGCDSRRGRDGNGECRWDRHAHIDLGHGHRSCEVDHRQ